MLERNPELDKKDFDIFFKHYIHLLFHTLGMSEESVLQPVHYEQIGKRIKFKSYRYWR